MNNTVDPNDLDSIDALLDEAELEAATEGPKAEQVEVATPAESNDLPSTDDVPEDWGVDETEQDPAAGLLDELEDDLGKELEEEKPAEPVADTLSTIQGNAPGQSAMTENAEKLLEKRAQVQKNGVKTPSKDADVGSIKKLIVIFSSVIIFLTVTEIGIGIWGALPSEVHLNKETLDKIDGIESNTAQSLIHTNASEKTLKTLDKKLDALSFQLEQLNGDLVKIEAETKATDAKESHEKTDDAVKPVAPEMKMTPELMEKLNKVGAQMTSAQRRLYEVNQRVKRLQSDYKHLLRSIKTVEKQLVADKVNDKVSGGAQSQDKNEPAKVLKVPGNNSTTAQNPVAPQQKTAPKSNSYSYPNNNGAYTY